MHKPYFVDQIREKLNPIFRKNNIRRATLFGSYVKNLATEHSDVDLLVDSGLRGLQFFGLLEDVCTSLECDVDLIDIEDIVPDSNIDREIRATGVVIYEQ